MPRAQRLLDLIQLLRRHRHPVSGNTLAADLGISIRTLYRDIATLQSQGADIEGEPGVGYILKPGFLLPPLMFSPDEIEALLLGSRWVALNTDSELADAARNALVKIAAVLPSALKADPETSGLLIAPPQHTTAADDDLATIRHAIRTEHIVEIAYRDSHGSATRREIWPFALGYFEKVRVICAWCDLRQAFRHFRVDRIDSITVLDRRYPKRRATMLKQWRQDNGISLDDL